MQFKHLFFTITLLLSFSLAGFAQEPTLLEHGGGVRTVEFSPVNASLVASAGESNLIKLWNLKNNTVRTLRGHTGIVSSVAFSPNGKLLASVSDDRTLKLWNVRTQQNIATLRDETPYRSVAFSPDGQILATGGGMHVKLWDRRRQAEIATLLHDKSVQTVAFSHDGQFLAAGDGSEDGPGTVKVWDVKSRQVVVSLNTNPKDVKAVEFSSDDRYLVGSGWNGHLKIWDVSNWKLFQTIPNIGHYDIAFSPDSKMIASTNSLWWVADGTMVAQMPEPPIGWVHPIDFSHDGGSVAVGAEDGIIRIWRIDTSPGDGREEGAVQILHIDTYFQELPKANSANGDNIPEPALPPAVVRNFFKLDPFYEQWINVGGLPVIASAKVNPYALKEAAWLIEKMIGHRQDILRALVEKNFRFVVIGHTEMMTDIPEYSDMRPKFYVNVRVRGVAGNPAVSSTEDNLLEPVPAGKYEVLIHEFAHSIQDYAMPTVDSTFDNRVAAAYDAAMEKGLWQNTYAATNKHEYWAESSQAWFNAHGGGSFKHFGKTRADLKTYDPTLAALLTEVYGDRRWRYTPLVDRIHLPHLHGFDPQDAPVFQWPKGMEEVYTQLKDPNIKGNEAWINLTMYQPNKLSHLLRASSVRGENTEILFFSLASFDVLIYKVSINGREDFVRRFPARHHQPEFLNCRTGDIFLVKDTNGRNLTVFQAVEKTGRAIYIGDNDPQSRVVVQSQRSPMYWVEPEAGTLHRLIDAKVETLVPSVQKATSFAIDIVVKKLYWAEKTSNRTGRIRRANLDGTNGQLVKDLTSVPHSIAIDTVNRKLYLTNAWGKVQRLNFDGSGFEPNLITGLDAPKHLALDVAGGKLYWTEGAGRIQRANLNGSNIEVLVTNLGTLGGIAIDDGKLYWTEQTDEGVGRVRCADSNGINLQTLGSLQSVPLGITVDNAERKLYWTTSGGTIQRANLNGSDVQTLVVALDTPTGIMTLGTRKGEAVIAEVSVDEIAGPWLWMIVPIRGEGGAQAINIDSLSEASNGSVTERDVATNGAKVGSTIGNFAWTLGEIDMSGINNTADGFSNNINDVINKIGLVDGGDPKTTKDDVNINNYSSYALITLKSAKVQDNVKMYTGSDDAIKVWLNGEVVHNNPINRGAGDFQETFSVDLKKGNNLLLVKVSEKDGLWSMFVGIDADVNAVYKRPPDPVPSEDVNGDGIVNILDLVLISANFGKTGPSPADVNGDGVVNIVDLVKVAGEMGTGAAAPSAHPQTLEMLTAADVRQWLTQAQQVSLTDAASQRGILILQQLLAALIPKETALLPNYPNPFNPETWIPYQLSKPAEVTLHIYSVNGTLVRALALGHQPAGMYHGRNRAAYWDGRNEQGEHVASGVYFYTLSAGDFASTRRMLILK